MLQICCIAFAFMAGEYSTFLASMPDPHSQACARRGTQSGPQSLWTWLIKWDDCHIFDSHFLIMWGARCALKAVQELHLYSGSDQPAACTWCLASLRSLLLLHILLLGAGSSLLPWWDLGACTVSEARLTYSVANVMLLQDIGNVSAGLVKLHVSHEGLSANCSSDLNCLSWMCA